MEEAEAEDNDDEEANEPAPEPVPDPRSAPPNCGWFTSSEEGSDDEEPLPTSPNHAVLNSEEIG